jgi:hypothetical protein
MRGKVKTGIRNRGRVRAFSLVTIVSVLSGAVLSVPLTGPVAAAEPAAPAEAPPRTVDEAITEAHRTGKPVEASGAATETNTVTANPNGTVTFSQTATPTRKKVGNSWQNLDATLVRNSDGTWSPKLSQAPLKLSGGGTTPMAAMGTSVLGASIDAPMDLPAPTVSGDTATYAGVLPGVDLQVRAQANGGFSEVFVVRDATAAANPALATLALPVQTRGLTFKADKAGNLTGADRSGRPVLAAAAPTMWDSTPTGRPTRTDPTGLARDATTGQPARSTFTGPGAGAKIARIGAAVGPGHLELTPDRGLLTGARTTFPVFIDPTFHWLPTAGKMGGWATISRNFPGTNYWKDTPDPRGRMQAGYSGSILSRTLINFSIPVSTLTGATIDSALLKVTQTWAYSCNATRVNVYAPDATLTASNATWNAWDDKDLGSVVDYATAANGYNSSCPAKAVPFDVKSTILDAVKPSKNKKTQTFVLKANDESATSAWKEFLETSPTLAITYNHKPAKPSGLYTAPKTSCTAGTVIGEGSVTLYATVSDPDASTVGVSFKVWKSGSSSTLIGPTSFDALYYKSGSTAVLRLTRDQLNSVTAAGASSKIYWQLQASDYGATSDWSTTCNFVYDRTRPSAPEIDQVADETATVGDAITIAVNPPVSGTVPTSYLYQLNGGAYGTVTGTAGAAQITVIPNRFTNTLTVTGRSAGGNVGADAAMTFNANPAETAADADLDGDNLADLVTTGGNHSIATGLWLAAGKGDGRIAPAAANIGSHGNGIAAPGTVGSPADFTGGQAITGHFFTGDGPQDVLVYYPTSAGNPGGAVIMRGNGDGSAIPAERDANYHNINAGTFIGFDWNDFQSISNPIQVTNAGAHTTTFPDLIGIAGKDDGSTFLAYYPNNGTPGGYGEVYPLLNTTPTGGTDWSTWTITSAQTGTGTALFLHQASTGKLFLWNSSTLNTTTGTLDHTGHLLSSSFNTGGNTLQAADVDGDGTADLWSVGDGAASTAWLVTNLDATAATGTISARTSQKVLTGTHAWLLNDHTDQNAEDTVVLNVDSSHVAKDSIGTLDATATTAAGTAVWNSGDLFDPDVRLSKGALAAKSPAVTTNADFTVDVWAKPSALGGVVLSQDGSTAAGFRLWADASTASWRFGMTNSSGIWTVAAAANNSVKLGVWAHLTASFSKSTGVLDLHVNGKDVATAVHLAPFSATGVFRIGADKAAGTVGNYFSGQIAEVLTFNQVVIYDAGNDATRDFNGDGKTDVFGRYTDGSLRLFRGNGAGGWISGKPTIIGGTGFGAFDMILSPGDFDGDGYTDLITRKSTGELFLYTGNGTGGWKTGQRQPIGAGFQMYDQILSPGDFTGDGFADILCRKPNGELYYYAGNGVGGWITGQGVPAGEGFQAFNLLFSTGDFSGDGHPDLLTRKSTGELYMYTGTGTGGWKTGQREQIGTGFQAFSPLSSPGDFNGDGHADLIGRRSDNNLYLYKGDGAGYFLNGNGGTKIGVEWGNYNLIF